MAKQTRRHHEQEQPPVPATTGEGGSLGQVRQSAERLLDATDAALARALSGNAERFLAECRQQGGQ